jgi:hypothetical protein
MLFYHEECRGYNIWTTIPTSDILQQQLHSPYSMIRSPGRKLRNFWNISFYRGHVKNIHFLTWTYTYIFVVLIKLTIEVQTCFHNATWSNNSQMFNLWSTDEVFY